MKEIELLPFLRREDEERVTEKYELVGSLYRIQEESSPIITTELEATWEQIKRTPNIVILCSDVGLYEPSIINENGILLYNANRAGVYYAIKQGSHPGLKTHQARLVLEDQVKLIGELPIGSSYAKSIDNGMVVITGINWVNSKTMAEKKWDKYDKLCFMTIPDMMSIEWFDSTRRSSLLKTEIFGLKTAD